MENKANNKILSKFISKEVEMIYEKYRNVTEEEINLMARFIRKLEGNKVDFYDPYLDYNNTKALAEELGNEDNIDVIKLYIFLKSDLELEVELEAVRGHYEDLKDKGYKQIDRYLLYYDYGEDILKSKAEDILVKDLEDAERVVALFDSEAVAYMWIFKTAPRMAAKQFIEDNGWQEALDIEDLGRTYKDVDNSEVYYCLNEGCDIFA